MRSLLVVFVLGLVAGCGGHVASEGADCSYIFPADLGGPNDPGIAITCADNAELSCCSGSSCAGMSARVWHQLRTCPNGCSASHGGCN